MNPTSSAGDEIIIGEEPVIAEGVRGYTIQKDGCLYVPLIIADRPGTGDVGRYLDSLTGHVKVPNVLNAKLEGMLKRRGFKKIIEVDPTWGEVEVWERQT